MTADGAPGGDSGSGGGSGGSIWMHCYRMKGTELVEYEVRIFIFNAGYKENSHDNNQKFYLSMLLSFVGDFSYLTLSVWSCFKYAQDHQSFTRLKQFHFV